MPTTRPPRLRPSPHRSGDRVQVTLWFGGDLLDSRLVSPPRATWPGRSGPAAPFAPGAEASLLAWEEGRARVRVPAGATAWLWTRGGAPRDVQGDVPLGERDLVQVEVGRVRVGFRRAEATARVRGPWLDAVDRPFAALLVVLVALSLGAGVWVEGVAPRPGAPDRGVVEDVVLLLDDAPRMRPLSLDRESPGAERPTGDPPSARGRAEHRRARAVGPRPGRPGGGAAGLLPALADLGDLVGGGAGARVASALDGLVGPAVPGGYRVGRGPGPGGLGGGGEGMGPGGFGVPCPGCRDGGGSGPVAGGPSRRELMPRVEAKEAEILGSAVDRGEIDRVVKSRLAELRHCYERELSKDPDLSGKVGIRFVIAADGAVSSASVGSSTMRVGAVGDCLAGRFLRMRFPSPRGGGVVVVSYPLVFRAAGR